MIVKNSLLPIDKVGFKCYYKTNPLSRFLKEREAYAKRL